MEITSVRRSLSIRRMNGPDRCFPLCRAIIEKYRERESSLFSCPIQRERFTKRLMEWRLSPTNFQRDFGFQSLLENITGEAYFFHLVTKPVREKRREIRR